MADSSRWADPLRSLAVTPFPMHNSEALVYFFGDWPEDEQAALSDAAMTVTPDAVRQEWNSKLGHLWMMLRHADGRLSAQMGMERVEAVTADALADRIRAHRWDHAGNGWTSRRRDARFRA